VLSSVLIIQSAMAADTLKGIVECTSRDECLGANRVCSYNDGTQPGRCVCREGYVPSMKGIACLRKAPVAKSTHVTCSTDEDCNRNEVCMSWQYDPALEYARKLRNRLSPGGDQPEKHQFCIDAWIIYNNHLEDLDEPRTGGGLRSSRRNFDSEEYYFSGRRPPRQYNAYGEDMMLILFLVCILATLVTVHRAACYRQIQDARRNTPLRHILPIPEDRPPPYTNRTTDSVDGLMSIARTSSGPKPLTEAPPPTYEEALVRQTTIPGDIEEQTGSAEQVETVNPDLVGEVQETVTETVPVVNSPLSQTGNEILDHQINNSEQRNIAEIEVTIVESSPEPDPVIKPEENGIEGQHDQPDNKVTEGNEVVVTEGKVIGNTVNSTEYLQGEEEVHCENNKVKINNTSENISVTVNIENERNPRDEESDKLIDDTTEPADIQQSGSCESDKTSNSLHV